jgi:hypothetical protein
MPRRVKTVSSQTSRCLLQLPKKHTLRHSDVLRAVRRDRICRSTPKLSQGRPLGAAFFLEQILSCGVLSAEAPSYGAFCLVIVMVELTDFFQKEAHECRTLAAKAVHKNDREYWLGLALRWEEMLPKQQGDADLRTVRSLRPRPVFARKPQRAA